MVFEPKGPRRILHVVDRTGGLQRLVVDIRNDWLLALTVQECSGAEWRDVAGVTVAGGDLHAATSRYRAAMEQVLLGDDVGPLTGLACGAAPKLADGTGAEAIAADSKRSEVVNGKDKGSM